jgi:hypothetical protein
LLRRWRLEIGAERLDLDVFSIKSCNDFMKRGYAARFGEKLKFLSPQQATGYFGIFTTAFRALVSHFRFKKVLSLYLNSSRAASIGEFKFKHKSRRFSKQKLIEAFCRP